MSMHRECFFCHISKIKLNNMIMLLHFKEDIKCKCIKKNIPVVELFCIG